MNTDGGPAFPVPDSHPGAMQVGTNGMSLRDWFAGQALAGWAAGRSDEEAFMPGKDDGDWEAEACYRYADAMLRARERGQEGEQGGEKVPSEELPDEHWHKIQTRPSLSWHPARGWEAACELRGKMMYGRGKTIALAQAALRAEWEGGAK